jgi:glycosyltransferase involved in cell wall biosynthesis
MTEELVSIIIPAFNAERFIAKALESVRAQTYRNWEIIVINDGGTDDTSRLVTEFKKKTSRNVRLVEHGKNQGLSAARDTGIGASEGNYIALLDADDFWLPDHLENTCSILRSGSADLAYSDCFVFRENQDGKVERLPIDTIEVTNPGIDLFRRNFINPSGVALTRKLAGEVGDFDPDLLALQDLDYWIRATIHGFRIAGTGKQTYYYRKTSGSLSSGAARMAEELGRIYEKHRRCGLLPEPELVAKASDSYFAAGKLYWRKDASAARRNFKKSWTLDKRRIKPLLWSFLTAGISLTQRS